MSRILSCSSSKNVSCLLWQIAFDVRGECQKSESNAFSNSRPLLDLFSIGNYKITCTTLLPKVHHWFFFVIVLGNSSEELGLKLIKSNQNITWIPTQNELSLIVYSASMSIKLDIFHQMMKYKGKTIDLSESQCCALFTWSIFAMFGLKCGESLWIWMIRHDSFIEPT